METTDSINPITAITAEVESQAHTEAYGMLAIKKVNDSLSDASKMPDPVPLFMEFWYEGEVSCLFSDSNLGKSIYAVQIAAEIAKRHRILYLDCELSEKQFQLRYTDEKTGTLFRFPQKMYRAEIDSMRLDLKDYEDQILQNIEGAALKLKCKIIIIDNLTYLCNSSDKGVDAGLFMMKLMQLKKKHGWSILIIAHTPKRSLSSPITQNDLAGSKKLYNFFDSVFAIGKSAKDDRLRYVKQLKVRAGAFRYNADNVLVYEIEKTGGYTHFEFLEFSSEYEHLREQKEFETMNRAENVIQLHREGKTYREIADLVGLSKSMIGKIIKKSESASTDGQVDKVDKVDTLPEDIVPRSIRMNYDSHFVQFLRSLFDAITVQNLVLEYKLGVTRAQDVIFYQIDVKGRVRTGKIMKYDPETGHRIKDENTKGRITWVHSMLKYSGQLPQDWTLTQCLFGEHLLPLFPEKPVAIVESEKTAVICAGLIPKFIWLATGGKSQLNDRLSVLAGRSITAFPDIDGFDTWQEKAQNFPDLNIKVADLLVRFGTEEDLEAHIDIADWLIRWHRTPNPRADATFAAIAEYFSPEVHQELRALIHDLDLELVEIQKYEPAEPPEAE